MDHLFIRYFSATGNTKRAVEIIGDTCKKAGIEGDIVELLSPEADLTISARSGTETLFAFPVLGFGAPQAVLSRIRALSAERGALVHILAICGSEAKAGRAIEGWPGSALDQVAAILARSGCDIASTAFISYPANWTQMLNPPSGKDLATLLAKGDEGARARGAALLRGDRDRFDVGPVNRLWGGVVNWLFRAVGRRFLGTLYAATARCTGCGLCASTCPVGSIKLREGRPSWNLGCLDCNRCINICPAAAIQVSTARLALYGTFSIACMVAAIVGAGQLLPAILPGIGPLGFVLGTLLIVAALTPPVLALVSGPLERLVRLASRIPAVDRLFSRGYTARFGRYRAPGFSPAPRR